MKESRQLSRVGCRKYIRNPWNWVDVIGTLGVYVSSILFVTGRKMWARPVAAWTVMCLFLGVLFHLRGLERTSFLVTMLMKVMPT